MHVPRLKVCPDWNGKLLRNELADLKQSLKNMVEIPLKSAVCPGAVCPGGVLLTEVEASPLQVMCGGAVNRQPGYRARNLQRRGSRGV